MTGHIKNTLTQRSNRYGEFSTNAEINDALIQIFEIAPAWQRMRPVHRYVLRNLAQKLCRLLTGDPEYPDNWHDIAGNAMLAEERCVQEPPAPIDGFSTGDRTYSATVFKEV